MSDKVTSTYVSRVGRLGNSLFQIAAAIGYGCDHNKKPVFERWDYQEYVPLELIKEGNQWNREAEHGLSYRKPDYQSGDVDLQGHFISENYFKEHRSTILNTLKLTPKWESYIQSKYGDLLAGNNCSIHVRRTDYLQPDQMKTHGVLNHFYYRDAYSHFKDVHYVVFSDDIEWCKLRFGNDVTYIENESDIIDMFIMSKCKNHIIANSTFSWWSAWLSGNKTIAPKHFFIDGYTWPGMYKEDWILI